jgi:uncharacterized membrane protein YoaK (UPF0700 family)
MSPFFTEVRETLAPPPDAKFGPLPPMLVGLTVVTRLVDAFSYLALGHVFVANMTGNIVILALALAGAPGFSAGTSLAALAAFWVGAALGGRLAVRLADHRGRHLSQATRAQAVFMAVAVVLAVISGDPVTTGWRYPLVVVLALAMGVQNTTARHLAVPDLTTTVLTLTITGSAASAATGGLRSSGGRRVLSITAIFAGALAGAVLVIHHDLAVPLGGALAILALVSASSWWAGRSNPAWVRP